MGADSSGGSGLGQRRGQATAPLGSPAEPARLIALPAQLKHEPPPSLPPPALERHCLRCEEGEQSPAAPHSPPGSRDGEPHKRSWNPEFPRQGWSGYSSTGGSHAEGRGVGKRERVKPHPCPVLLRGHPSHSAGREHKG